MDYIQSVQIAGNTKRIKTLETQMSHISAGELPT